ncbi:hypothetical protein [Chryseobacterium daeguense]|uniref:hypothetical protein n=1 Tax=Chryseobacterium daeguense TaxID=412438 RepID=UPI000489AD4D|nr:hypothetical protein [Chryseobacterium daeguense]
MEDKNIVLIGKSAFWISFILGNICLFGYIFTKKDFFVEGGLMVVCWGFILNMIITLVLIIYGISTQSKLDLCLKAIGIMLINIPVAIIYTLIGINIVRI